MEKRTRYKITIAIIIFMMGISIYSLKKGYTDVTIIALGVIASSGLMYKHSETKRPS